MEKLTAVEWLVRKISTELIGEIPMHRWDEIRDVVQQALQMEKEQMFNSFEKGYDEGFSDCRDGKKRIMNIPELRTKFNS